MYKGYCDLLNKHISIKILYDKGKESHRDYGKEYEVNGTIKLFIINGHYLLNKTDILLITRLFINHPRNFIVIDQSNRKPFCMIWM